MTSLKAREARERVSRRSVLRACLCALALNAFGCSSFQRSPSVDVYAASRAVTDASAPLLKELDRRASESSKRPTVCFIGVSGARASAVSDAARGELECGAKNFRLIEKEAGQEALKKSKTRANDLFIPAQRKKFIEALGEPIDYLVAGYVEPIVPENEDGAKETSNKMVFRLTMIEVETNKKFEFAADI